MSSRASKIPFVQNAKEIALLLVLVLTVSSLTLMGQPANANTATNPTIVFDGNTLAASVPATQSSTRVSADSLSLSTESLTRTASTTRTGYTFGGWSLVRGGPATSVITTTTTSDTSRTLFAVWNTTINYNLNGAESGTLSVARTSETYRFGQVLTLPTVGTLVRQGYSFGGWMTSSVSTTRSTTYQAASDAVGNPTLFAAWIKTVSFNANGASVGTIPTSLVYVAGGSRLKLPVASEMTLRRPGYEFVGWSLTPTGAVVSNPTSYVPVVSQRTLFAIWKIQATKLTERVFFAPDKSTLRATQKLVLRDLVDRLDGKGSIRISLTATRAPGDAQSLGKARNTAVVNYLRSLGLEATFTRVSKLGTSSNPTSSKNNRVTLEVGWTNPTN